MLYGLTCYAEYVDDRKQKHVGRELYIQQRFICVRETVLEKSECASSVKWVWNEHQKKKTAFTLVVLNWWAVKWVTALFYANNKIKLPHNSINSINRIQKEGETA